MAQIDYPLRKCRICNIDKKEDCFYKNDPTNRCKTCETSRKRKERKLRSHFITDRNSYLKKAHNVDLEFYNKLFQEQNGVCAICNKEEVMKNKNLCIDHCHSTGNIRGLLCHSCNVGIGHFKDNLDVLKNAINYLKNNGTDRKTYTSNT